MIVHKHVALLIVVLTLAVLSIGCGGSDDKAKEIVPNRAEAIPLDKKTVTQGWEDHEWGEFKSTVLARYNDDERDYEISRFDYHWSGEYRSLAGQIMKEKISFADGRFYNIGYTDSSATENTFTQMKSELVSLLGPPTETKDITRTDEFEFSTGRSTQKVTGITYIWTIGVIEIKLERSFDSKYAHLSIQNTDILYRRGKWAE